MTYPIIIPLHHGGGKLKDDTELRFALRSLEAHFKDDFKVVIVGHSLPEWLKGVEFIDSRQGLKTALLDAANAHPDGFFWWYDDVVLLKDQTGEEMKVTPAMNRWIGPSTSWSRSLDRIRQRLTNEGHPTFDYSRPHGPYWFDKSMVDEGFKDWPGIKAKFPWESWILSKRNWPRRFGVVKQYYGAFNSEPGDGAIFLNYNDVGNTDELRSFLGARFPDPSMFEDNEVVSSPWIDEDVVVADCTRHTHGLGNRITILCSAYAAAKATNRKLIVAWQPGNDCQANWSDLFAPMEDVTFVDRLPSYGSHHIACCHTSGKHGRRQIDSAKGTYDTPAYWDAWRECASKIRLNDELAEGMPTGHHAIHIRSLYPKRQMDCNLMNWCAPFEGSYLACDGAAVFDDAIARWPHLKYLHKPCALTDRGDGRKLEEVRKAARDLIMLTQAKSIIACGGSSTFRNLAHIGHDVPLYHVYKGGAP
jgi:hypothetical protein